MSAADMPMTPGTDMHDMAGQSTSTYMSHAHSTVGMFSLMVMAMMIPATFGPIRVTAARSLWRRRQRAIAVHLVGYLAAWICAGAVLLEARSTAADATSVHLGRTSGALALALAALWQLTSIKRRALYGHNRTRPLAPSGLKANRDCLVYGVATGLRCMVSCGPMMIAMTLAGRTAIILVAVTVLIWVERYRYRPPRRLSAFALILLAAFVALV
jgi:predicted metal-binding membrane protein